MLYFIDIKHSINELPARNGLVLQESTDILLLSLMARQSHEEIRRRIANDNKAFIAFYKGIPAAFGWMAMGKAHIGELNHEFILPIGHRYLWNFRTLEEFRGLGIYPRLLQYILKDQFADAECFWILHAPENDASRSGILKAGFTFAGNVSVLDEQAVINTQTASLSRIENMQFAESPVEPATCWMCSSPFILKKTATCCCEIKGNECNGNHFSTRSTTTASYEL